MADRLLVDVLSDGRVSVSTAFHGALPGATGPPTELGVPLGAEALEDLRWYLEDYLVAPFSVYEDRGTRIAAHLRTWGETLFEAVFRAGPNRDAFGLPRGAGLAVGAAVGTGSPVAAGPDPGGDVAFVGGRGAAGTVRR
jgi:hypothetical protein